MNGYVESGYIVCLGALGTYATSLVLRERSLRAALRKGVEPELGDRPEPGAEEAS